MRLPVEDLEAVDELFHGESIDLNEYPTALRGLRKCRSFRADLQHKLSVIVRAQGGWGKRGIWRASDRLSISRHTLRRWFKWETAPRTRLALERIDNAYEESLEILAKQLCKRKS